jgi:alanine racemase
LTRKTSGTEQGPDCQRSSSDNGVVKSWVEVSRAKIEGNVRAVQAVAGAGVEVLAVVKANGYGHDARSVAPLLVGAGWRWLGVSDVQEGERVRSALGAGTTRLLVMCGMEAADAPAIVAHGLTAVVWTVAHVVALERAARAAGTRVNVHLEIDTGMARQGVVPGPALAEVAERLAESRWVCCEGVMSHLSSSEVAGSPVTAAQRERFGAALEQVLQAGIKPDFVHLGNTSAVDEGSTLGWIREVAGRMGAKAMVRTGLAVYGYCLEVAGGSGGLVSRLQPALTWKTHVIDVREVGAGDTVGYGATFTASGPMRLALLPVGYADGFRRAGSSGVGDGWVMIAGQRAPIVGRVSMNLTSVDVSGIDVGVGDEVVLLGEGVTAEDHARWSGTISYDILCGMKARYEVV